jgi:hypothetical protein
MLAAVYCEASPGRPAGGGGRREAAGVDSGGKIGAVSLMKTTFFRKLDRIIAYNIERARAMI